MAEARPPDERDAATSAEEQPPEEASRSLRQRLSRLWSRRNPSRDAIPTFTKFEEQQKPIREEVKWIESETERLEPELELFRDVLSYARITAKTPADIARIEEEFKDFESQAERLYERRDAVERAVSELESDLKEVTSTRLEQYRTANVESEKLLFEVFKLIATLATATVVAVSAVTGAFDSDPVRGWMLGSGISLLLISVTASVLACLVTAIEVGEYYVPERRPERSWFMKGIHRVSIALSIGGLALGVTFSSMFLSANFERLPGVSDPPAQPSKNAESAK